MQKERADLRHCGQSVAKKAWRSFHSRQEKELADFRPRAEFSKCDSSFWISLARDAELWLTRRENTALSNLSTDQKTCVAPRSCVLCCEAVRRAKTVQDVGTWWSSSAHFQLLVSRECDDDSALQEQLSISIQEMPQGRSCPRCEESEEQR